MDRLSSDNLYHFKGKLSRIQGILKIGYTHRMWGESIPYRESEQNNFIVCFCDIKPEDTSFHRKCYGNNALVMTKEWGVSNNVSPVRYVLNNSPGVQQEYIRMKNHFREIRMMVNNNSSLVCATYPIIARMKDKGILNTDSIQQGLISNNSLETEYNNLCDEFNDILLLLDKNGKKAIFFEYLKSIMNNIFELHTELEKRDAFMRAYKEDFSHPTGGTFKDKVLYDEREWRSIKFADNADYDEALKHQVLPESYNLKFTDDDLLAILVEDQNAFDQMQQFISTEKLLVNNNKTQTKIHLIDTFTE